MFKPVLITRDSYSDIVEIWDPIKGVCKVKGCTVYYGLPSFRVRISLFDREECKKEYGAFPGKGQAWYVEEKRNHILWTRYDHLYKHDETIQF